MNHEFVRTQMTLLQRIAIEKTGEDEATWARFFELYYPAMVFFAKGLGGYDNAEDVASEVLVKLVDVLRHGKYERQPGKSFRAYVKTLIRNQLNDLYRKEKARGLGLKVELTDQIKEEVAGEDQDFALKLDTEWAEACQSAAVEHVLTKTALSEQSKSVYREYVVKGRPIDDVANEFGISKNVVSQIKTRIERMISAIAAEYGT